MFWSSKKRNLFGGEIPDVQTIDVLASLFAQNQFGGRVDTDQSPETRQGIDPKGIILPCSEALLFFMQNKITMETFDDETLDLFSQLDDFDIVSALKSWQKQDDFILSSLSKMIINRDLLKIKLTEEKPSSEELQGLKERFASTNNISLGEANYFIFKGKIKNQAYSKEAEPIRILKKTKQLKTWWMPLTN